MDKFSRTIKMPEKLAKLWRTQMKKNTYKTLVTRGLPGEVNGITNVLKVYQLASSSALVDEGKEPSVPLKTLMVMK